MLCPYAQHAKSRKTIICKILQEDDCADITQSKDETEILCAFQRYCPIKGEAINSDGAKKCKLRQSHI